MCRSVCAWRPFSAYWRLGGVCACQFPLHRLARTRRRPTHSHTCCTALIHYQPRPPPAPPPLLPFTESTSTPFSNFQPHPRQFLIFQQALSVIPRLLSPSLPHPPEAIFQPNDLYLFSPQYRVLSNISTTTKSFHYPSIVEVPLHPNLHQHLPHSPPTTPVFFGSILPSELTI